MGKVFKKMVNNRIKDKIRMAEYQAGGQAGKSTVDHINILNSIINCNDRMNWDIYFGYCYWDGNYLLYAKRSQTVVRGRLSTARCHHRRLLPDGWWPLAVAGGS